VKRRHRDTDDQREDRVRSLRARIERGEYRVPAETVADAVIEWYRRVEPINRR
jgi:anti-sigma28 factor (negative regulator of flagellin synthesis)